jgi:hypothetical protein
MAIAARGGYPDVLSGSVASLAIHVGMNTRQRKARLLMPLIHLPRIIPLARRVTFRTGVGELTAVNIEMAALAVCGGLAEIEISMTGSARHLHVAAFQRKMRGLMIEEIGRASCRERV